METIPTDQVQMSSKRTRLKELHLITEGIIDHVIKTQPKDLPSSIAEYLERILFAKYEVVAFYRNSLSNKQTN